MGGRLARQGDTYCSMKGAQFVRPSHFVIQWELTERCNWHCKHCYGDKERIEELPFKALKKTFTQCLELFETLKIRPGFARINISGGEPFLRKDFFEFLSLAAKYRGLVHSCILTNGSFITDSVARDLKKLNIFRVQVSLDGLKEINDGIRNKGAFDRAIKAIKLLRKYDISTRVSMVLTRINLGEVDILASYLKDIGVNIFGTRRHSPIGRGEQLMSSMLSPLEQRNFYFKRIEMKKRLDEDSKFFISDGCEDGVSFLEEKSLGKINCGKNCEVIHGRHLTIFANGDILACRRLPVVIGNVLRDTLLDVYFSSDKLWAFRNLNNAHPLCKKCPVFRSCLGGAKCISRAYFRKDFAPDPQCWRLFKELPSPDLFSEDKEGQCKEIKTYA